MKTVELNNKNMNIFKRFWYALVKPNRYKELSQDGLKKAIVYILILMLIASLCFTTSTMLSINKYIADGTITFEEGKQPTNEYLFAYYFTTYFLSTTITNFIYLVILVLIGWVISKIFKLSLKFKELISIAIYSFTLPSIIYIIDAIINYFVTVPADIINEIYIIIIYIYFFISLLFIKKREQNK